MRFGYFLMRRYSVNLKAVLEGILFVVGDEGISKDRLLKILGISVIELQKIIDEYERDLMSAERGLKLEIFNDNFKLVTKKEHADFYRDLVSEEVSDTLSSAALEVLAIIAYNGPITRMMVDEIRGVGSIYVMRKLILKNLIKEVGKSDLPGRPILYGVTDQFLDYFGLKSLDDLPKISEDEPILNQDLFTSKYKEE